MDPLSIIVSTIGVVQAVASAYTAIQEFHGLPDEFREVNRTLPLAKDTLCHARDQLQDVALDESSKKALQPLVSDCEEKAKMLRDIFENVHKNAKDGSALHYYRIFLSHLGKAHRVETLMQGIMRGLDVLSTNRLFKTATQRQVAQLKKAIDQLSNVESSVPDSFFEASVTNSTQNIASGGTGYQSINSGRGHKINSGSGKQFIAQTMNFTQSSEYYKTQKDILRILHTTPYPERKDRNLKRVDGTCEWFISHDHFQKWRESKYSSMLWVSANPGCGKSVLAKYLVDSKLQSEEPRTICYFFFKDDFEDQRSAKGALSCILHQLFTRSDDHDLLSYKIVKHFDAYQAHIPGSIDELWNVLVMAAQLRNAGEIVCILDAFDECEDKERHRLAQVLRSFYDKENDTKNNVNLKFLVTSRPSDKIGRGFQPLNIVGLPVIHLKGEDDVEISKIAREIDLYIEYRVSCIRKNRYLQQSEEELLLRNLRRIPNHTYLWVYLTLELVEEDMNISKSKISEVTSSLPRTLDEAYNRILTKCTNPEEAKKMLHIVVAATRPLTLVEMDFALALKQTHKSYNDLDNKPEQRISEYVRNLCGLFVTVTDKRIYLLHQTAKEFLVQNDDLNSRGSYGNKLIWKSSLKPAESHDILYRICIWHLLFTEFNYFEIHPQDESFDEKVSDYLRNHVFLDYSASNWATHFRSSGINDDAVVREICDTRSKRPTWFKIYWAIAHGGLPRGFTTLMVASYFGLGRAVNILLQEDDVGIDSKDRTYQRSALSWASENGFDDVVKLLIKGPGFLRALTKFSFSKGADVDGRDGYGRTPLSYAAWNGHMTTVQLLIDAGARVDSKDNIGGTPMSYALCSGHETVASRLMRGAPVGPVEDIRRELLLSAAKSGHEPIVKRLLDSGATAEVVDDTGRTALSYAAGGGHVAVARLLLDKGAVVDRAENRGNRTPLAHAIDNGSADIIDILLEKKPKVNFSYTPLVRILQLPHN